jgi:dienelactone hydrolase
MSGDTDRSPGRDEEVTIPMETVLLAGHLTIPDDSTAMVIFAHGSGSSRHSPRNRFVAQVLNRSGLGTLLFDLLTTDEERDRANVFDIELLAGRLVEVTRWLASQPGMDDVRIGYFGASTGAAAALTAAAESDDDIGAVVSRGGRPDLAGPHLSAVTTPTLLIVGGHDHTVVDLNRQAQMALGGESHLEVVPGATHLFEERGALEHVAALARDWFTGHLAPVPPQASSEQPAGLDPLLERAREQAEGSAVYEDPLADAVPRVAREEAQGVEVFVDPDQATPSQALRQGSPGHETFVGDQIEPEIEADEERREPEDLEEG